MQGIVAAGKNPERFGRKGRSPLAFLGSLRAADGSYRYSRTSVQTPVWVTAQAIAAVRRKALPLRPVPRRPKPARTHRQVVPELGRAKPIVKRAKRAGIARALPVPSPSRPAVAAQRTAAAPRDGADSGGSIAGPALGIALAALLARRGRAGLQAEGTCSLNCVRSRADALTRLQEDRFDVVVIGGGITGAGVALDAATRGYSVALVERDDWSCGTSSRSSKMIHGGLRYLQNFDLGLVREALLERQLLVRLAPHLVKPLPFLVPSFEGARPDRRLGMGLNMYDVMAARGPRRRRRGERDAAEEGEEYWSPDRHRTIEGPEVVELMPALEARNPTSAYLFYDCQTDDSRMVLTVLGEAERFGAVCVNGARVVELIEEAGRAAGVVCRGAGVRRALRDRGRRTSSTRPACGRTASGPRSSTPRRTIPVIRPSRGTHVLIDREQLPLNAAAIVPAGGGRTIFALPWLGQTLIGTTDNDYEGSLEHPRVAEDDAEYLLEAVNTFFETDFGLDDVAGAYAGVRPLISTGDPKKSVDISRKAELFETSSGMITITGGKFTTWRRMAKMAVDRMVEREFREAPCRTHEIPLGHAVDPRTLRSRDVVPEESLHHLANRYGLFAERVLELCVERPELGAPIVEGMPDLLVEALVAARFEQARSVPDVLLRRTRLGLLAGRRLLQDGDAVKRVAEAMGRELGWNRRQVKREAERWREAVDEESLVSAVPAGVR